MIEKQTIVMLTKKEIKDNKRKSIIKIMKKKNGKVYISDYDLNESKYVAADYYFVLCEVVKNNLDLVATIEQMNFIPEVLEFGVDKSKLKPYSWELSVPSNYTTYQKIFNGDNLKTQKQVFDELLECGEII